MAQSSTCFMRHILLLFCFNIFFVSLYSQTKGIQFRDDFSAAFKQADKEDKLVFAYFYVPNCNACDWLEEEFRNTSLGNLYNDSYLSYKLNASLNGKKMAEYFGVFTFPTLLFIHPSGEVRYSARGYRDGKAIFEAGKLARKSKRDIRNIMDDRYKKNPSDTDHLYDYIEYQFVRENYSKANKLIEEYLDQRSNIEENAWMNLVLDYGSDVDSPAHEVLLEEKDLFIDKFGKKLINETIWNSIIGKLGLRYDPNNISHFHGKFMEAVQRSGYEKSDVDLKLFYSEYIHTNPLLSQLRLSSKDKDVLTKYALESILVKDHKFDRKHLLSVGVHLLRFYQKQTAMAQLNDVVAYNHSLSPHYSYLDMQSLALYALGESDAAVEKITNARELALSTGVKNYKPSITEFKKLGILK